ncbi:unnamed protein product [Closterium sp. Yama58-4]|nr:unnamed protein product [Closterium sp. Yama58-4]
MPRTFVPHSILIPLLLLVLSSLLSVSCRPSPLATSNASKSGGGKSGGKRGGSRGGKPGGKPGGKSGGSKKGVSALSCPSPWPELDSCPTSESLPQLEDAQTEFPGAVWGALRPHKVPGVRNSPADATWLNKDERDTEVYIEECCSLCALNDACEYWTFTRRLDSIKGTCQLFSSQQCAASKAYSAISAPASSSASSPRTRHPVSSPKVSFSFRKAPKDAALPTPGGSDGTGGNGGAGGGTGAGTLYSDTSAPATSAAANVARGRLYGVESPAAGWSVIGEAGYLSIGGCCQACKAGASNDCYYWTWQHDPKEGDYDRGLCTLFHSQACRFMTDEGFLFPPVFDPAQTNTFMFPLPCYSAL